MDNYSKKSSWNKTGAGNKLTDLGSEVLKSRVPRIMMIIIIHICKFICRTMQKYPFLKTKLKSSQWSPRWPIVISKSPTASTEHLLPLWTRVLAQLLLQSFIPFSSLCPYRFISGFISHSCGRSYFCHTQESEEEESTVMEFLVAEDMVS